MMVLTATIPVAAVPVGQAHGLGLYGLIALVAVLAHESWRWLGLWLASDVDVSGEIFQWVRYVATALVAALVLRLVVFPSGQLADVAIEVRLGALAVGVAVFFVASKSLLAGIIAGALAFITLPLL